MSISVQSPILPPSQTYYGRLWNYSGSQIWNTSTPGYETFNSGHVANYHISATEVPVATGSVYVFTAPSGLAAGWHSPEFVDTSNDEVTGRGQFFSDGADNEVTGGGIASTDACIVVTRGVDDVASAANLLAAYTAAKALTPGG